ncbi:hypothetical protein F0562_011277 [Nyssa sinensis]|uniref:Leucine-rich repeat-containing N-terminal plant-type domain-containing protein n=1 Tax=Nyssa sinensis TaxID=561372 RepID=A0A5J5A3T6_9ASTE|nr:hypothetical protein F0562_011277 [Nyssa sinensis]
MFMNLLFLLFRFHLVIATNSSFSAQPLCHDDERSALLLFKQSFVIAKFASRKPSAYPKAESWNQEGERSACCSWDGVECDKDTSHVIGLDLSSSFLFGSINSTNSLFNLVHLQKLNLSDNHFNYSQIPSAIGHLSRLTSLDLSMSAFFGQIPPEISTLSRLTFLDLSVNIYQYQQYTEWYTLRLLKLENPSLRSLVQNLTNLEELYLSDVNISSTVPDILTNLSALTSLGLQYCGLYGEFPSSIFLLPNLRFLNLRSNQELTGYFPKFLQSSPLELLSLSGTSFSGKLPDSIGNLNSLKWLRIEGCNFSGSIPPSIGNLTQLRVLNLGSNYFTGQIPPSLANLNQLIGLSLANNNFNSDIPSSLGNLTRLIDLDLYNNQLVGEIPSCLGNLTQLIQLVLCNNKFHGPIPQSIFELTNLMVLNLYGNDLSGTVEVEMFIKLKNLIQLQLGSRSNKLSLLAHGHINATLPKFKLLALSSCNLSEFPEFLRYQDKLEALQLDGNNIHGHIPKWIWNPLCHEDESSALWQFKQSFSISEHASRDPSAYPKVASWKLQGESNDCCLWDGVECNEGTGHVIGLDLSSSLLYGSINSNSSLFRLAHLQRLHLADNDFNYSPIPSAIGNLSELRSLDLYFSSFNGQIPLEISMLTQLTSLNLSFNPLKLHEPSLATLVQNLTRISELSLSNVSISSEVPDVLVNLPSLTAIVLRNCGLHGEFPIGIFHLPKLQVLSVRFNQNLTGYLPEFHQSGPIKILKLAGTSFSGKLPNSIGNLSSLSELDLSECNFSGSLPASLSNLTQLTMLDLESNDFGGQIPSLASLSQLTSLSLSFNEFNRWTLPWIGKLEKLSELSLGDINLYGEIPVSLANLTQLTVLNLYSNHLFGQIPSWLMNLTHLTEIQLMENQLQGPIPSSFSKLKNLEILSLSSNNFNGTVDMDIFLKLKNLISFQLSGNNLSLHISNNNYSINATLPKFELLGLESCNLREFPNFLRFQDELKYDLVVHYSETVNVIRNVDPNRYGYQDLIEDIGQVPLSNLSSRVGLAPIMLCDVPGSKDKMPIESDKDILRMFEPLCHDDEISALLQFKQSFSINRRASDDPSAYPKVVSWKLQGEGNDCCSWDGVECDEGTGHVIGLNLTSSLLYGSINSNSSLFRLVHLQRLHLADNHFNYSQIPSRIGHLLELRSLDLSYSVFSGQFPTSIFHLPKLQVLSLQFNQNLTSYLPEFHHSNPLKILELTGTSFFGKLPDSIGNLSSLILLDLRECHFSGLLPTSLNNLTQLTILELWSNNFSGQIPSLASLSQLTSLSLSFNNFNPTMLPWIGRLKRLSQLLLDDINMYATTCSGNTICFRHMSPPPSRVRPVVVALGGYRRLYMVCLRRVMSRLAKLGLGGGDSDLVRQVWFRHQVELSLLLFCVDYYERLGGGRLGDPASSLMFLCKPVNV